MRYIGFCLIFMMSCQSDSPTLSDHTNSETPHRHETIEITTPDSILLFGDLYELDKKLPVILLFHQGGSNARAEYGPIIPRLLESRYNILSIDQRMGGQVYGKWNRTLANIDYNPFEDEYGYCDAYNNLESSLEFIIDQGFTGPKIIWGSSYSATLAIQLASNRDDVHAILAFSPPTSGPLENCKPELFLHRINQPLLVLLPLNESQSESKKQFLSKLDSLGHQSFIASQGVHGSSMLVEERVGASVEENWDQVLAFLDTISAK